MNTTTLALLLTIATVSCGCASDGSLPSGPFDFYSNESVIINGSSLTDEQLTRFHFTYGMAPMPGSYWYDPVSGLYGTEGYPPAGFLYAGHDFGYLSENASGGVEPLWFNGRRLTTEEVYYISLLIGTPAQPGSYWFDAQGNVGVEGSPYPLVNLHAAASTGAASVGGGGGGGDNFWSSMMGAGNSTADNSQGYVSVPGYGPVSYGF